MATGESAFDFLLPLAGINAIAELNKSTFESGLGERVRENRTSSYTFIPSLKPDENNLVNSNTKKRQNERSSSISFMHLVNAYKIISSGKSSPKLSKKEMENQSSGSGDETNCTASKRFESEASSNVLVNKIPVFAANDASSSDKVSVTSSGISRPKRFGDRPDVIFKTILRSFKKYYLSDFNEVTDYKKKKRRIANQTFLIDMTAEYCKLKFSGSSYTDLGLFIAALVQPKLPPALDSNARLQELSRTVCEVLYRFNKSKMNDLL